jgi:hypothetical protein
VQVDAHIDWRDEVNVVLGDGGVAWPRRWRSATARCAEEEWMDAVSEQAGNLAVRG